MRGHLEPLTKSRPVRADAARIALQGPLSRQSLEMRSRVSQSLLPTQPAVARSGYDPRMSLAPSFEAFEIDRLRAHFEFVVALLRAQPTSWLDADGLAAREWTLALLESYAERGRFPRNETTSVRMLPSFVDSRGTECAVAHLMMSTGSGELAERVRSSMNVAYVREIVATMGDEIAAWARGAGLTEAEAALVQPDYCPQSESECQHYELDSKPGCLGKNCGCVLVFDDGEPCDHEDFGSFQGVCRGGECVHSEPAEEAEDGCLLSGVGLMTGSAVPVLAALVLLTARRRSLPGRQSAVLASAACGDRSAAERG